MSYAKSLGGLSMSKGGLGVQDGPALNPGP